VIDASGAGSPLSPLIARAVGFGALWGHVPWPEASDLPKDRLTQRYRRAERMAGVLPIGRLPGSDTPFAAVFWSLPQAELARWPKMDFAAWREDASRFWPDFAPFLSALPGPEAMTPAFTFIGDAAHRSSAQLGQGANMTLLDAFALSLALCAENPLPNYARMRRWHVRCYQIMSAALTPTYQSQSRLLPPLRDHNLAPIGRFSPVCAALTALVSGDLRQPLAGRTEL
jgi:2-polyprenyl-6-methoxyphenol hydroxylase-like FAD-dependent oxidoreductase